MFSFNSPYGACPECSGLGVLKNIPVDLVLPDMSKSLNQGAVSAMGWNSSGDESSMSHMMFVGLSEKFKFSMDTPVGELPRDILDIILYGTGGVKVPMRYESISGSGTYNVSYEGIIPTLMRRYRETTSDAAKAMYESFMTGGALSRLPEAAEAGGPGCYHGRDESGGFERLEPDRSPALFGKPEPEPDPYHDRGADHQGIARKAFFLRDVGLDYLSLSRAAATLSGGESQRIRLATQISSGLVGVLYILDEPSIGLHQGQRAPAGHPAPPARFRQHPDCGGA